MAGGCADILVLPHGCHCVRRQLPCSVTDTLYIGRLPHDSLAPFAVFALRFGAANGIPGLLDLAQAPRPRPADAVCRQRDTSQATGHVVYNASRCRLSRRCW